MKRKEQRTEQNRTQSWINHRYIPDLQNQTLKKKKNKQCIPIQLYTQT